MLPTEQPRVDLMSFMVYDFSKFGLERKTRCHGQEQERGQLMLMLIIAFVWQGLGGT
jgi:hypothetical protein